MRKADNLPPSCAVVTKSGNLNFLEPSGPVRACSGTAFIETSVYFRQVENRNLFMLNTNYQCAAVTLIRCKIFVSFLCNYTEITAQYIGHIFRRHFLPVISISLWKCRQYLQNRILQRVVKFVNKFEASVRVCQ